MKDKILPFYALWALINIVLLKSEFIVGAALGVAYIVVLALMPNLCEIRNKFRWLIVVIACSLIYTGGITYIDSYFNHDGALKIPAVLVMLVVSLLVKNKLLNYTQSK